MKGRSTNAEEKRFHDMLANHIGCIACAKDGMFTSYVSIHHIDGRVKKNAHWWVLPLCGPHHQDAGLPGVIAVHPWKTRFVNKYGPQLTLIAECIQILLDRGLSVPHAALVANGLAEEVTA